MTTQKRMSKDEYFMRLAVHASSRSTCLRRQEGAVLVRDGMAFSTGYNGAPKGLKHCVDVGCLREMKNVPSGEQLQLCRGAHAEANAIVQAAYLGVTTRGSELYTTLMPCPFCSTLIINSGIVRVVYGKRYRETLGFTMMKNAGIEMVQFEVLDAEVS